MIKEFKNIRERSERAKFLCLGYKTNNCRIEKKNAAPKRQLDKILGPRARPLRPHFRRLCVYGHTTVVLTYIILNLLFAYTWYYTAGKFYFINDNFIFILPYLNTDFKRQTSHENTCNFQFKVIKNPRVHFNLFTYAPNFDCKASYSNLY